MNGLDLILLNCTKSLNVSELKNPMKSKQIKSHTIICQYAIDKCSKLKCIYLIASDIDHCTLWCVLTELNLSRFIGFNLSISKLIC